MGDSTVGETRALHRALTAVAGQRWLLAPPPGTDLGALAERIGASEEFAAAGAVVWPDDAGRPVRALLSPAPGAWSPPPGPDVTGVPAMYPGHRRRHRSSALKHPAPKPRSDLCADSRATA
ncbi:hypothetical protein [Nocardiopsis potens]|uniref:hypothetical protein n=1 Tax=Nocardiopsis potens TaxID=1246458 RepID=UPI0013765C46|nr:hypothetical protein [Nocardiopsis potens]